MNLDLVLASIRPDREEQATIDRVVRELTSRISDILKRDGIKAEPRLVGSVSKGTHLKDADIDIFIVFSREYREWEMESMGLRVGHEVLPEGQEKYAEHPYVSGRYLGRKVDIVPCYQIPPGTSIISSVDRTPLHTEYVKDHITDVQRDEVRLLKAFMKTAGVYGSEVKVSGFSGYVCELLVLNFGTFMETIRYFSTLTGPLTIPEDRELLSQFDAPAVIIDPTDPGRNAGAAISLESLSKMKMLSKIFLSSPSEKFFSMVQPEGEIFGGSRDSTFALFTLPRPDEIDDVIYPQAVRLRNILMGLLSREGFLPIDSEVLVNERVQILVECERGTLPRIKVHEGPPVDSKNAMDFYAKWKGRRRLRGPYIRGNRLYVDVERSEVGLEEVVRNGLRQYNIGAHLNRLRDSLEIIITAEPDSGMEIFRKYLSRQIWP